MVYKGRRKKTIHYYTIKSVEKVLKPRVLREVRTMHALQHPNVLHFHQWYETTNHLWLILEYCVGGDLLSLIRQDIRLPEASVHDFGRDLVSALLFLHSQGVLYCDLKPSNILLDENGKIKLGDFGLARRLGRSGDPAGGSGGGKRGTPCYMAPELLRSEESPKADVWAAGVMLYELLTGRMPFGDRASPGKPVLSRVWRSIMNDPLPCLGRDGEDASKMKPYIAALSPEARDLIARLLDRDESRRPTAREALEHPFLTQDRGESGGGAEALDATLMQRLQAFGQKPRWKRSALQMIMEELVGRIPTDRAAVLGADTLDPVSSDLVSLAKQYEELRHAYADIVRAGEPALGDEEACSRTVGSAELAKGLRRVGFVVGDEAEEKRLIQCVDVDGTGQATFQRFASALLDWETLQSEGMSELWLEAAKQAQHPAPSPSPSPSP